VGEEEKGFQVQFDDRIHDVGFLNDTVIAATSSELTAYDLATGERAWADEGANELGDRGRRRLLVGHEGEHYIHDGESRGEVTRGVIAETPTGARRLRRSNEGELLLERLCQSFEVTVPDPVVKSNEPEPVTIRVRNVDDSFRQERLSLSLSGGKVLNSESGPFETRFGIEPLESFETDVQVRLASTEPDLNIEIGDVETTVRLDTDIGEPDVGIRTKKTRFEIERSTAELEVTNLGDLPLQSIDLTVADKPVGRIEDLQPDETWSDKVELQEEPGATIKAHARAETADGRETTDRTSITVPKEPLTVETRIRERGGVKPSIEIAVRNESEDEHEEHLRINLLSETYVQPLDDPPLQPGSVRYVVVLLQEPPIGEFPIRVEGERGLLQPVEEQFDGRSEIEVDREVELWSGRDRGSDEGTLSSIPRGEVCVEKITLTNRKDEPLKGIKIESDNESEQIKSLHPEESVTLSQKHALYDAGLPTREVLVGDRTIQSLDDDVTFEDDKLVLRARVERKDQNAKLVADIKNTTGQDAVVRGVGIHGTKVWFSPGKGTDSIDVPGSETVTVSRSIPEDKARALRPGAMSIVIVEYAFGNGNWTRDWTATLAQVLPIRLEDVLNIEARSKGRDLIFEFENKYPEPVRDLTMKWQPKRASRWSEQQIASSIDPGEGGTGKINALAPSLPVQGISEIMVKIQVTVGSGRTLSQSYDVIVNPTFEASSFRASWDWQIEPHSHNVTPYEPSPAVRSELTVSDE